MQGVPMAAHPRSRRYRLNRKNDYEYLVAAINGRGNSGREYVY